MIHKLLQLFKELGLLMIKIFLVCLSYTISLIILITFSAGFSVSSSLFLHWLIPFVPFELWVCFTLIFVILFGVFNIEEIKKL